MLKDYKPNLLRKPGAIDFEHFLEKYLGVELLFKDIYHKDPEKQILATTVFRDGVVKVFDREKERIANIIVRANTVIIDNLVMERGKEGFARFTGMHEGGHILMHYGVYSVFRSGQTCCRRDGVEKFGNGSNSQRTAEQWREYQADYFASAVVMPNATFIPAVNRFLRDHGVRKGSISLGVDDDLDILARDLLPEYVADIYGVSKRAATVKLRKNGFVSVDNTLISEL